MSTTTAVERGRHGDLVVYGSDRAAAFSAASKEATATRDAARQRRHGPNQTGWLAACTDNDRPVQPPRHDALQAGLFSLCRPWDSCAKTPAHSADCGLPGHGRARAGIEKKDGQPAGVAGTGISVACLLHPPVARASWCPEGSKERGAARAFHVV
ncbi:hypothetical protein MRX96_012258 [Rhipicephalus microplus]